MSQYIEISVPDRSPEELWNAGVAAGIAAERERWASAIRAEHRDDGTGWCHECAFAWPCRTARLVADLLGNPGSQEERCLAGRTGPHQCDCPPPCSCAGTVAPGCPRHGAVFEEGDL